MQSAVKTAFPDTAAADRQKGSGIIVLNLIHYSAWGRAGLAPASLLSFAAPLCWLLDHSPIFTSRSLSSIIYVWQ
jgi:hypothetical protein